MEIPKFYDSSLPAFISWFILVYLLGYFIIFKNWGKLYRAEASSCLMSLAHGNPAFVSSIFSILLSQNSVTQIEFASPNTAFQNSVLEYSIAYFLLDLLHYIFLVPSDVLFIVHHLATLYVFITCRYVFGVGAVAILGILVLAEATTTCQNTWSLARYRKDDSTTAAAVLNFLSPIFYAYYSVVRGILGPLLAFKIGLYFTRGLGDGVFPNWAWISWIVVIGLGIGASILWVLHLWIDFYRERTEKNAKKLS
ncbi:TLC domain-containing protein At5g14285-like [Primulina huaijiensis]|uniref:TLC domain-containing protein At5g14285-like n=1 Tax=Primulina huaijiensis TaxID=1492673 RepID=UPI003CC6F7AD